MLGTRSIFSYLYVKGAALKEGFLVGPSLCVGLDTQPPSPDLKIFPPQDSPLYWSPYP